MLIRLCDLTRRQQRPNRPGHLVGKAGPYWLMLIPRHDQPDMATLFIGNMPTERTTNRPLPPIWDAATGRWIGPADPSYPTFYDDTAEAVVDLAGRGPCVKCGQPVLRDGGLRNAFGELVHLHCQP